MYQEMLQIIAILSIVVIAIYPILSKSTESKTTNWLLKRFSFILAIYTIGSVVISMLQEKY